MHIHGEKEEKSKYSKRNVWGIQGNPKAIQKFFAKF